MKVRTRIAPSPTGQDLHIGNAYTALINYVFAKKNNGQFLIRIEDTDRSRLVEGSEQRILQSLEWLGIPHDEGPDIGGPHAPYRQSERLNEYKKYAEQLVSDGHAYYCFCTPERLDEMRKNQEKNHQPPMYDGRCKHIEKKEIHARIDKGEKYVIRLNVPDEGTVTFHDLIRGDISFENKLIDDQVLLKSDGFPTYHLGVVVDDHLMGITHVIRGEEWISSTPKQILLFQFFGWEMPDFAHVSVLRNPDRSKLSKRKNPVWASDYRAKGFLPDAMKNYMATMAWTYPGKEIFTVEEMISKFDIADIQTTAPIFDQEKLRWMNGEYIKNLSVSEFILQISHFYNHKYDEKMVEKIWPLVRERVKTLAEFETMADFFFTKPASFEHEVKKDLIATAISALKETENWTHDAMEQEVRTAADKAGQKARDVFMELRIAITGKTVGPPLLESLEILGKKETLQRLADSTETYPM